MIFVLLLAVMLPLVPASAQDEGDELIAAPEASAVYFLSAASGSFADQGDGTYLLTLEGVDENIVWIMAQPVLAMSTLNNVNLNNHWANAEALTTDAVLEVDGMNVMLTLSSPTFEAGVQTFVATVGEIVAPEGVKEPELPLTFEAVHLSIAWTIDFQDGLVGGIQAMYEGLRATPEECAAAQAEWDAYSTWRTAKTAEYVAASNTCRGRDGTTDPALKAAACDQKAVLAAELNAAAANIAPTATLLANECQ